MKNTMNRGTMMATFALAAAFAGAQQVQVTVDGRSVKFDNAQPQMANGRVLVPLRGVFEQMGATVNWDEQTQSIMADEQGRHIRLQIGSNDASVNGRIVSMDVPPQLINGSTMVPLRFLSESLGAHVDWQPESNLVAILSRRGNDGAAQRFDGDRRNNGYGTPPPTVVFEQPRQPVDRPRPVATRYEFNRDTVIAIQLDESVSSDGNRSGDRITATVRGDNGRYLDFPEGTVLEGVVRNAQPASGDHGGVLDIRFTHIRFPDGNRYKIGGVVMPLNDKNIARSDNGKFIARSGAGDVVARDAEVGAGAGLILGSIKGRAVGGAIVGGAIGAIVGAFDHHLARNVNFDQGTRFGLVLNHDLSIDRNDLRRG